MAVGILERLGRLLWGFPPNLMRPIVEQLGSIRALLWFVRNMPRYERTLQVVGPVRTHLLCTVISLHNGCRYCAYGHAYALDLVLYRDRNQVLPVDAATLATWTGLPAGELRERLSTLLQQAKLHVEVLWVDRALAMAGGGQRPIDSTEARVAHLVRMFATLNRVGIAGDVEPDEAHDPANKDTGLRRRHAEYRAALA